MSPTLEQRLKYLEDLEAVRSLRHAYAIHANIIGGQPGDLDAFSQLFTETGVWDIGPGRCVGPTAIKECMQRVTTQWHCVIHFMANPIIKINGDVGTGLWTGLFPFITEPQAKPTWSSVLYHDEYVRTEAGWRFQSVTITRTISRC